MKRRAHVRGEVVVATASGSSDDGEPETPPTTQHRAVGAVLVAAPFIFFVAEFITAAAWTDPPYSYTHHYISNLGVRGPLEALGQFMRSPLAWVMNTGFFLFGITLLVGVALLRGRSCSALILAAVVAVGSALLAFFPGSGDPPDGGVDYHSLGALATMGGGHVLAIVLARQHRRVGVARRPARALLVLGVIGLVSLPAFLAVAGSGANVLVGLVERAAAYPFLLGFICVGASIACSSPLHQLDAGRVAGGDMVGPGDRRQRLGRGHPHRIAGEGIEDDGVAVRLDLGQDLAGGDA